MRYLIFLGALLYLSACTKPDIFNAYDMKVGETVAHSKQLSITLDSIQDSRCPTGSICIWAGVAVAYMHVITEDDQIFNLELEKYPDRTEQDVEEIAGFKVTLLSVEPYPETGDFLMQEDYLIRIVIE